MKTIAELTEQMIVFSNGNLHDITHFITVWTYAKTIGELEELKPDTQYLLEASAIVHDIACPLCREKYGHADGKLQEKEGPALVRAFLADSGMTEAQKERIAYLVGHHHTLSGIEGDDYQILIEADYLVNADEMSFSAENIRNFRDRFFRTKTGTDLLNMIYTKAV